MIKKYKYVFQFRIDLRGIKPPIWRRILVPETYSFWDLHVSIQDAMGWSDYHLHEFRIKNPGSHTSRRIGIPEEVYGGDGYGEDEGTEADWDVRITDLFSTENDTAFYNYDFGDDWEHKIKFEKRLPSEPDVKYPICIKGKRACPPEDCGGMWGYEEMLNIIKDPEHEEYEEYINWLGGEFDPEHFEKDEIKFDDPGTRLKRAMG